MMRLLGWLLIGLVGALFVAPLVLAALEPGSSEVVQFIALYGAIGWFAIWLIGGVVYALISGARR